MKKTYTKRQIREAIAYWQKQLDEGNCRNIAESEDELHRFKCDIDFRYAGEDEVPDDADIEVVPDDDFDYEAQYNASLPPEQRKKLVRQSQAYLGYDPNEYGGGGSAESFQY